jgi:hypothetical protein
MFTVFFNEEVTGGSVVQFVEVLAFISGLFRWRSDRWSDPRFAKGEELQYQGSRAAHIEDSPSASAPASSAAPGGSAPSRTSAWRRLYTTADRSVDIQLAGIHRREDLVLSWVRFSFVKDQHDLCARSYRSMLQQWAYQCAAGRHALVQFAEFTDGAGAGTLVAADSRDRYEWSSPEPDSLGAAAMKVACAHDLDTSAIVTRSAAKQL